jgi:alkanesulfonate monooxygenase SsuD/methylene tetrahydromethanopterin reductase-like flavin-dependent oxidoreductase (luciferase family)
MHVRDDASGPVRHRLRVVDTALEVEQLGYYDAGGNDHLSTMRFVREAWSDPPDYFEPLVTLAHIAAKTSVLRLTTGIMVLPMREPVLMAKQVATPDQLSGGRVMLGVAVGGYRDEFEAVRPDLADANRAELTREIIEVTTRAPRATACHLPGHLRPLRGRGELSEAAAGAAADLLRRQRGRLDPSRRRAVSGLAA